MSERDAFLAAIAENPDDDTGRLVFADWLDERNDPLGEFIRVQIKLARLSKCPHPEHHKKDYWAKRCMVCSEALKPRRREAELRGLHPEWARVPCPTCKGSESIGACSFDGGKTTVYPQCVTCGGTHDLLQAALDPEGEPGRFPSERPHGFARGFLSWVGAPLEQLGAQVEYECPHCARAPMCPETGAYECGRRDCENGAEIWQPTPLALALVESLPLTELRPSDRTPYHNGGGYCWFDASRGQQSGAVPDAANIPTVILDALPTQPNGKGYSRWRDFPTAELAVTVLGRTVCELTRDAV